MILPWASRAMEQAGTRDEYLELNLDLKRVGMIYVVFIVLCNRVSFSLKV